MKSSGATLFPLVLMGLLAALTFWLEQLTHGDIDRSGKQRHDPDFIVETFRVRSFDDEGLLQHTVAAQKMFHFPDDESTDIIAPRITYHRGPTTVATAGSAWMDKDGTRVRLEGDVRVVRLGVDGAPESTLSTRVLHMVPDDEYLHTDAPVAITHRRSVITGRGLTADNKTQLAVVTGPVQAVLFRKSKP